MLTAIGPFAIVVALAVLVLAAMPSLWPGDGGSDRSVAAAGATDPAEATQPASVAETPAVPVVDPTPGPTPQPTPAPTIDPRRAYPTPIPAAQRRTRQP